MPEQAPSPEVVPTVGERQEEAARCIKTAQELLHHVHRLLDKADTLLTIGAASASNALYDS